MNADPVVAPGGWIGILGGGQLGRMLALAAAELGINIHILDPDPEAPAADVAPRTTRAAFDNKEALTAFARSVDVITYEFENVPAETAAHLAGLRPVFPGPRALATAQDRLEEKSFIRALKIGTAPFAKADTPEEAAAAASVLGLPAILKTRRLGYDGKGQVKLTRPEDAVPTFAALGGVPCILERFVAFEREISVIAARGHDASLAAYDPVENIHENHILRSTLAPARIAEETAGKARAIAQEILTALDYVGVMGVEMFVLGDGSLLVNELAPRVHNSGHWTMDACYVSQFEQHIKAVAGWPLGTTERHSDAIMHNLLGQEVEQWRNLSSDSRTHLHVYGKRQTKPGRKMGHYTRLYARGLRPNRT
ncbi:MAG: 5-(carboxyamino)imidazole ribonucleotide synthase [Alphaproteobacteria bacterium]|nr:5-(carboxyamino)imidazole ribonucleotide synthase [Alphaproteobacteria bacterium]